jgi:hypothetical protein
MLISIHIGHTHPTCGHLLCGELAPICTDCVAALTASPTVVECPHFDRDHLHGMLSDILGDDCCSMSSVLAFLSAIGLAIS